MRHSVPIALFLVLAGYFTLALRLPSDDLPSALINKPAPVDLAGLDGAPGLDHAAFAGWVVLVNFFASWCIPCRLEHPRPMDGDRDQDAALRHRLQACDSRAISGSSRQS